MSKTQVLLFLAAFMIVVMLVIFYTRRPAGLHTALVPEMAKAASIEGCYISTIARDTFQLAITSVNGQDAKGSLSYNFFEKDDSKGTWEGKFSGGTLLAEYTFNSEGSSSVRQVAFKKVPGGFK